MKIAICSGSAIFRRKIHQICSFQGVRKSIDYNILEFTSGKEVLEKQDEIDILILEIDLPDISGIDIKNQLRGKKIFIIFISDCEELIADAFGKNVLGFLTKPFDENQLCTLLIRAMEEIQDFMLIQIDKSKFIRSNEVIYIKSDNVYSLFYIKNGERYIVRKTLNEIESLLTEYDCQRVHKSYLVNMHYVKEIKNNFMIVYGHEIPVSRRRKKDVEKLYEDYLRRTGDKLETIDHLHQ